MYTEILRKFGGRTQIEQNFLLVIITSLILALFYSSLFSFSKTTYVTRYNADDGASRRPFSTNYDATNDSSLANINKLTKTVTNFSSESSNTDNSMQPSGIVKSSENVDQQAKVGDTIYSREPNQEISVNNTSSIEFGNQLPAVGDAIPENVKVDLPNKETLSELGQKRLPESILKKMSLYGLEHSRLKEEAGYKLEQQETNKIAQDNKGNGISDVPVDEKTSLGTNLDQRRQLPLNSINSGKQISSTPYYFSTQRTTADSVTPLLADKREKSIVLNEHLSENRTANLRPVLTGSKMSLSRGEIQMAESSLNRVTTVQTFTQTSYSTNQPKKQLQHVKTLGREALSNINNAIEDQNQEMIIPVQESRTCTSKIIPLRGHSHRGLEDIKVHKNKALSFKENEGGKPPKILQDAKTYIAASSRKGPDFTAVILVTYMRSGSSLTGDILQQDPNVFYIYEPLKNLDRYYKLQRPISFLNGTVLEHGQYNLTLVQYEALMGWLTCDMTRIFAESIADLYFMSFSKKGKILGQCLRLLGKYTLKSFHRNPHNTFRNRSFRQCVLILRQTCLTSKFRIVKTIRASMEISWEVLKELEGSKILHLIRDPRATIESKRKRGQCSPEKGGIIGCAKKHCDRVADDTFLRQKLERTYPKRSQVVLYESIAERPLLSTKDMYSFLNLDFTDEVAGYVYNITLGEDKTGCAVCQQKWQMGQSNASSKSHVESWKTKMDPRHIVDTQSVCKTAMEMYGYEYYHVQAPKSRPLLEPISVPENQVPLQYNENKPRRNVIATRLRERLKEAAQKKTE